MSMDILYDPAPLPVADRMLLVMLPGANTRPQDLVAHGFVRALRERALPIDVVVPDAHLDYYLDGSLSRHLRRDILATTSGKNYRRTWLMGISLGGMGALLHARAHPETIMGIILLAPYLGATGTIAEVVRAGGLARWNACPLTIDDDRRLLTWLKSFPSAVTALPRLYLGYGREDRFVAASQLLAERLPAAQVVTVPGGHDWATWRCLWQTLLDQGVLADASATTTPHARPSTPCSH
jgi:pimeloyl-ACP methyl ester carboxylesterase